MFGIIPTFLTEPWLIQGVFKRRKSLEVLTGLWGVGIHLGKEQGSVEEGASEDDAEMCVKACAGVFYQSEPHQDTETTW